jgi:hypothetical protein
MLTDEVCAVKIAVSYAYELCVEKLSVNSCVMLA